VYYNVIVKTLRDYFLNVIVRTVQVKKIVQVKATQKINIKVVLLILDTKVNIL